MQTVVNQVWNNRDLRRSILSFVLHTWNSGAIQRHIYFPLGISSVVLVAIFERFLPSQAFPLVPNSANTRCVEAEFEILIQGNQPVPLSLFIFLRHHFPSLNFSYDPRHSSIEFDHICVIRRQIQIKRIKLALHQNLYPDYSKFMWIKCYVDFERFQNYQLGWEHL